MAKSAVPIVNYTTGSYFSTGFRKKNNKHFSRFIMFGGSIFK